MNDRIIKKIQQMSDRIDQLERDLFLSEAEKVLDGPSRIEKTTPIDNSDLRVIKAEKRFRRVKLVGTFLMLIATLLLIVIILTTERQSTTISPSTPALIEQPLVGDQKP